ncbi:hypothetical protein NDU88_005592 [Pleurodeles waltl]|uniref:Uncharacterized protein n=1 Tax=Pleurodeles waltl TaxID=8319 RepID=A0AAV7SM30_PLEWA|nr:hypothetical protein NDU88_005592 [Pleurodeles waltl]
MSSLQGSLLHQNQWAYSLTVAADGGDRCTEGNLALAEFLRRVAECGRVQDRGQDVVLIASLGLTYEALLLCLAPALPDPCNMETHLCNGQQASGEPAGPWGSTAAQETNGGDAEDG